MIRYWYTMKLEEGYGEWRECSRERWLYYKTCWDYIVDVTEE